MKRKTQKEREAINAECISLGEFFQYFRISSSSESLLPVCGVQRKGGAVASVSVTHLRVPCAARRAGGPGFRLPAKEATSSPPQSERCRSVPRPRRESPPSVTWPPPSAPARRPVPGAGALCARVDRPAGQGPLSFTHVRAVLSKRETCGSCSLLVNLWILQDRG